MPVQVMHISVLDSGNGEKRMEMTIGQRIRECRKNKGMTQDELAERLLTKKSTVSAYENDKIDIKISILKQIAKELDTTVFYLAGEQDEDISNEVMQMARQRRLTWQRRT